MLRWIVAIMAGLGLAALVSKYYFFHKVAFAPGGFPITGVMLCFLGMMGVVLFAKFKK